MKIKSFPDSTLFPFIFLSQLAKNTRHRFKHSKLVKYNLQNE